MMVLWLLVLPVLAAAGVFVVPAGEAKRWTVWMAVIEVAIFAGLWMSPAKGINVPWVPSWGVRFHLGADGLSIVMLGLTAVLFVAAALASDQRAGRSYYFWLLFLEFASMGLFSALDLFLFYIFWEAVLIPIFFLLVGWGGPGGRSAGLRWLIMNLVGSLFMLVGIIVVGVLHGQTTGHLTFSISALAGSHLAAGYAPWTFLAFFVAFAIKAPLWPLHGWMPDAYGAAPAPVTALLSGILSKAGIYGFLRIMVPLFLPQMHAYQSALLTLAALGLVVGAFLALRQNDMKMVTAYGSLSHMGMMALGVFSLTKVGMLGATFYMVAHGLLVGGLFLVLGLLENRTGTRQLRAMNGLNASAPRLAAYFLFFVLGTLGLPGLPGFAGEYMIIQGLMAHYMVLAVVAAAVLVLASWYMLRVFQAVMQGPVAGTAIPDLVARQVAWILPLSAVVLVLGVWPSTLTSAATPSLYHALHFMSVGTRY